MKGEQLARIRTLANEQNSDHEKNGSDQVGKAISALCCDLKNHSILCELSRDRWVGPEMWFKSIGLCVVCAVWWHGIFDAVGLHVPAWGCRGVRHMRRDSPLEPWRSFFVRESRESLKHYSTHRGNCTEAIIWKWLRPKASMPLATTSGFSNHFWY